MDHLNGHHPHPYSQSELSFRQLPIEQFPRNAYQFQLQARCIPSYTDPLIFLTADATQYYNSLN